MSGSAGVTVFSDTVCELGEGPSWDETTKKLFWFDIVGRKLLEKPFTGGDTIVHDLPFMASAIAAIDGERQLVVSETGLHVRDRRSGRLTLHTPIEADLPRNRSNDSRVHPCGAFWIGTMHKDEEGPTGAFYWFFRGELRKLFSGITVPNSTCFSPDGRVAYYTDTPTGLLMRVACDPATGLPSGEPKVFLDWRGRDSYLDGSVVDADGVLWNARWDGGAVDAWSPDGRHIRTVKVPARRSSCPAFLGPGAGRIAVTTAWKGMTAAERSEDPEAGKTFLLDIGVRGRFEPNVVL
jgi:sugar lactone lactonase YvrE